MDNANASQFKGLLESTMSGYSGERTSLPRDTLGWWWKTLEPYPFFAVEQAFIIHSRGSVHKPKPADIISIINKQDGRPQPDEAWAIALQASSEDLTAIWTHEIEQAWYHCYPIFQQGDEVGARMAFRQRYEMLVSVSREQRVPIKWNISLGLDQGQRTYALEKAEQSGLITHERIEHLLPAPELTEEGKAITGLLGHDNKLEAKETVGEELKAKLAEVRALISQPSSKQDKQKEAKEKQEARREELIKQAETVKQ